MTLELNRLAETYARVVVGVAIQQAEGAGELSVEATGIVVNYALVVWSDGELPVDTELTEYLGGGQLVAPPDLEQRTVTFKLHECFPGSRYIVTDTSMPEMAEGMNVAASPALARATDAGATGRVNVLMGGPAGPGPMGAQPSVFDSTAGDPAWSPYWDPMTYAWPEGATPRVLVDEDAILEARDAGELEEFPGTPDTGGEIFTVNCPVPVAGPATFLG